MYANVDGASAGNVQCLSCLHPACTLAHLTRSGHVAAAHPPIYYNSFLT